MVTVGEGGGMFVLDRHSRQIPLGAAVPLRQSRPQHERDQPGDRADPRQRRQAVQEGRPDQFSAASTTPAGCGRSPIIPENNALYVPFQDQCLSMTAELEEQDRLRPALRRHASRLRSEQVHEPRQDRPRDRRDEGALLAAAGEPGSALVTAGDLVFWGDANRRFRAFDADDGKVLWESIVGGIVMASTITYAVNGKQYVMIFTGDGQSVTAGPLGVDQEVDAAAGARPQLDRGVRAAGQAA